MKRFLTLALIAIPLLGMAQDDLYFTSSKKAKAEAQKKEAAARKARTDVAAQPASVVDYNSNHRSEDEYNRRYVNGAYQGMIGQQRTDTLVSGVSDVEADYGDSKYDMDDAELDYRFSRRIVRFHSPRLYALASPYYWDLYYGYGAWDYLYVPYDPWYYHWGWNYGWSWGPWDCWYGGLWGWHRPHAWAYWGWGPGWHHGYPVHHLTYSRNVLPRQFNAARGHMSAGNRIRTNALGRTMNTRTSALNRTGVASSRTSAMGRVDAQSRTQTNGRSRTSAATRGDATRSSSNERYMPSRSSSNQNSSSRSTETRSRTSGVSRSNTTTRSTSPSPAPSRSSTPSYGGASRSGSIGGGSSRGGGSFGGGGGVSRGGGSRR